MTEQDLMWLWLGCSTVLSSLKKTSLLSCFGGIKALYAADEETLLASGLLLRHQAVVLRSAAARNPDAVLRLMERSGIRFIHREMPEYPRLLEEIHDPPAVLFVRGQLSENPAVAIVGTRRPTGYGLEMSGRLSSRLGRSGLAIVSGMARGIDTAAHCGALSAGAATVAVLACGVDVAYPPENRDLMNRIAEHGAVVSEYPPGTSPQKQRFPERNRIISGLTLGTIVVEAGERSGSLITSQCAVEQGRDVFAVPGSVLSLNSIGPNRLISEGARLVRDETDVLEELAWGIPSREAKTSRPGLRMPDRRVPFPGGEQGRRIYEEIRMEASHPEQLSARTGIGLPELQAGLLRLELDGFIRRDMNGHYHPAEQ